MNAYQRGITQPQPENGAYCHTRLLNELFADAGDRCRTAQPSACELDLIRPGHKLAFATRGQETGLPAKHEASRNRTNCLTWPAAGDCLGDATWLKSFSR